MRTPCFSGHSSLVKVFTPIVSFPSFPSSFLPFSPDPPFSPSFLLPPPPPSPPPFSLSFPLPPNPPFSPSFLLPPPPPSPPPFSLSFPLPPNPPFSPLPPSPHTYLEVMLVHEALTADNSSCPTVSCWCRHGNGDWVTDGPLGEYIFDTCSFLDTYQMDEK